MSIRSLHGSRLALTVGLTLLAGLALAQDTESPKRFEMTPNLVLWMYGLGIGAISVAWVAIVWLFAHKDALSDLLDLVKRGPLIKFVTVTYIIIVIVTLSLVGQLESSHVSTLLGAIAGYVLGDHGREDRRPEHVGPEPLPSPPRPPTSPGKQPGASPSPPEPQQASEGPQPPSEFHS
ncbi:MAG TPA: hypothetical protein VFZ09_39880 [Archangium sp.]|uniref:hypothetical protein n=1 Tax=Archangium sp. TaxID=1872627 RepID=UPI002E3247F4|nr:hypothetical protein [Archangium sp.]HEX5752434.1 hypothetical protein [Archangium sp.]